MTSFDISYDSETDFLSVTFGEFDDLSVKSIPLSDSVVLHTDISLKRCWGIELYNYSELLGFSQTDFTGLSELNETQGGLIMSMLSAHPCDKFFEITDFDKRLAKILRPHVGQLMA